MEIESYPEIFTNIKLFFLLFIFFVVFIYWINGKLKKGLKNIEFIKYNVFNLHSFTGLNTRKNLRNLVKLKKNFNYSSYNYYLITNRNEEIINLNLIRKKKQILKKIIFIPIIKKTILFLFPKEHKKISNYPNLEFRVYEVPKKYFNFNNLLILFKFRVVLTILEKYIKFLFYIFFPFVVLSIIYYTNLYENSIGGILSDYDSVYKEVVFLLFDTFILIINPFNLFILFSLFFIFVVYLFEKRVVYFSLLILISLFITVFFVIFVYAFVYSPLSFVIKLKEPDSPFIGLNNPFIKNMGINIKKLRTIKIDGKKVIKVSFDDKFLYYQDLKINEKNFFIDDKKRFKGDFKNTNCGELFHNIDVLCKKDDILNCEKDDIILSLIVNNKFFNSKNTEKIPLQYIDYENFKGKKIDIEKDIDFSNIINKCRVIEKFNFIENEYLSYKIKNAKTLEKLLVESYKKNESSEKKYIQDLLRDFGVDYKKLELIKSR